MLIPSYIRIPVCSIPVFKYGSEASFCVIGTEVEDYDLELSPEYADAVAYLIKRHSCGDFFSQLSKSFEKLSSKAITHEEEMHYEDILIKLKERGVCN